MHRHDPIPSVLDSPWKVALFIGASLLVIALGLFALFQYFWWRYVQDGQ